MLESIHVESYRTLRNTTVTFRDGLNIIIGQNGVGKSNLLSFLGNHSKIWSLTEYTINRDTKLLRSKYYFTLSGIDINGEFRRLKIEIEKRAPEPSKNFNEEIIIGLKNEIDGSYKRISDDVFLLELIDRHKYDDIIRSLKPYLGTQIHFGLPEFQSYLSNSESFELDEKGDVTSESYKTLEFLKMFQIHFRYPGMFPKNSVGKDTDSPTEVKLRKRVVDAFEDAKNYFELDEHLQKVTNISEIRLNPNFNVYKRELGFLIDNLVLEFNVDGFWLPWNHLSDGTKRIFYLVSEVAQAEGQLILIEEPELGLHPFQLQKIMTFLKEQSVTKQIILSTHSPQVLNILEPDELDQILIASISKGRTSFHRLDEAQKEKAKLYMTEVGALSDYWLHSDLEQESQPEYENAQ